MLEHTARRLPRLPRVVVDRPRLRRQLDRMAPLTLVQGLPGQGKTTLVAQWARLQSDAGTDVTWVDAGAGAARGPEDPAALVGDPSGPAVLVVDDADELAAEQLRQLTGLASGSDLHVVVVARPAPHVNETVRRHRIEVTQVLGHDLMLAPDELPAYADAWGHPLTPEQAQEIHGLVGGWLLPVRLVLDATPPGSTTPATHGARQFLEEVVIPEVVDRCGLEVATRLAVAERITTGLADALLAVAPARRSAGASGEQVVSELERVGLVTRTEGVPPAWQMPALVRRILGYRLTASAPGVARASHGVVARDLLASGGAAIGPALRHARHGADWRLLGRLWAADGWQLAVAAPADFAVAYGDLPDDALRSVPSLRVADSLAAGLPSRSAVSGAVAVKRRYVQLGADSLARLSALTDRDERFEVLLAGLGARRAAGRLQEAQQISNRMETETAARATDAGATMLSEQRVYLMFERGITAFRAADITTCLDLLTRVHETRRTGLLAAQSAAWVAMVHALVGTVDEARRWLAAVEDVVAEAGALRALTDAPAGVARGMLALDRLDGASARAALDLAGDGVSQVDLWVPIIVARTRWALHFGDPLEMLTHIDLVRTTHPDVLRHDDVARSVLDRCRADLLLALGEVNRVLPLVERGADGPSWLRLPAARLRLLTGDHAQAARIASAGVWAADTLLRDRVDHLVVKAAALLALGRDAEAGQAFLRAHALSSSTRNQTPYLGIAPAALRALVELSGGGVDVDVLGRSAARIPYPDAAELVRLSPREAEVLRQMRRHETATGVARALSVSVNTVKKQMVSLYAKLGVHDRTAALLRAERLGLIDVDERG